MTTERLEFIGEGDPTQRRGRGGLRRSLAIAGIAAGAVIRIAWTTGRLLLGALLVLVEPLLRITLVPLAHLGLLVTLFFGFLVRDPHFPRWGMLAMSVGALLLYWLYLALVEVVLRGRNGRD